MMLCTGYEMTIPGSNRQIPFASYETGRLSYGNGDPSAADYRSLSDFIYDKEQGVLEIRIPWQLLNVTDPSSKQIMGDFYTEQSIASISFEGFSVGAGLLADGGMISLSGSFTYEAWTMPEYRERLKPAYYVLQEALKELK